MDVSELVEAEQVQPAVAGHDTGEDAFVGGFDEFVDQLCGGDVADAAALFACCQPQPDEQVGLSCAGVPEQDDRFAGVQVAPGGEVAQGGGCDARNGVDVELRQPFQPRKLGVIDASGAAPFGAVVDLGGQHFGEVAQMGMAFAVGDLGETCRFGAHCRQVQLTGRGADRG